MQHYTVAFLLPKQLKQILSRLSSGLPNVQWHDSNFYHIAFRQLGQLSDANAIDIAHALNAIEFPSFFLNLQGLNCFRHTPHTMTLGVSLGASTDIDRFKSVVQQQLKTLHIPDQKRASSPTSHLLRYPMIIKQNFRSI